MRGFFVHGAQLLWHFVFGSLPRWPSTVCCAGRLWLRVARFDCVVGLCLEWYPEQPKCSCLLSNDQRSMLAYSRGRAKAATRCPLKSALITHLITGKSISAASDTIRGKDRRRNRIGQPE